MDIPDINVWLALVDQNHIHHATAAKYWQDIADTGVAFAIASGCRLVSFDADFSRFPGLNYLRLSP